MLITKNTKFLYSTVVNQRLAYKNTDNFNFKDEIKFRITDGKFQTAGVYQINMKSLSKETPVILKNDGLSAISGWSDIFVLY